MAVKVDIESLVVPYQTAFKVDGPHREYLRVYQHRFGQGQVEAGKGLLCVLGQQTAAGLFEAVGVGGLGVDEGYFVFFCGKAGEGAAGRSCADDGYVVVVREWGIGIGWWVYSAAPLS